MVEKPSNSRAVNPEEDPNSELNVLRREVRQLQAEVRDAALQDAAHQDEAASLRAALASAEGEIDEGLAREAKLRSQLELQRFKRQHLESTLTAAEALVTALRDMALEGVENTPSDSGVDGVNYSPHFLSGGEPDLDRVLSRIDESTSASEISPNANVASGSSNVNTGVDITDAIGVTPPLSRRNTQQSRSQLPPTRKGPSKGTSPNTSNPRIIDGDIGSKEMSSAPPSVIKTITPERTARPTSTDGVGFSRRHSMPIRHPRVVARSPSPPLDSPAMGPFALLRSAFSAATGQSQSDDTLPSQVYSTSVGSTSETRTTSQKQGFLANSELVQSSQVERKTALPNILRSTVPDAHDGDIFALASSLDGGWLASGGDDRRIRIYDGFGEPCSSVGDLPKAVTALTFGLDSGTISGNSAATLFAGGSDGVVRSFKRAPRRRGKWNIGSVFPVHVQPVRRLLIISGSVLSCSTDRWIKVSDVDNLRRPFATMTPSAVFDIDRFVARSDGLVASAHKDGNVRLWSLRETNANVGGAKIHSKGVVSVSCLADDFGIVSLGRDNALRLSDVRMGLSVIHEMEGVVDTVSDWHRAAVFNRYVVCGQGTSGQLGIWDIDSGKSVKKLSSSSASLDTGVLDLVSRKLRDPGGIIIPHWSGVGTFVCAHRMRQISFWDL